MAVPADDPRFECNRAGTAALGRLPAEAEAAMQRLITMIGDDITKASEPEPPRRTAMRVAQRTISRRTRTGRAIDTLVIERRRRRA